MTGVSDSNADSLYSEYTSAIWNGQSEKAAEFRNIWLTAQLDELPPGDLGEKYMGRIVRLLKDTDDEPALDEIRVLEDRLLKRRFSFSKLIGGREYSYRELSAELKADSSNKLVSDALIEEAFMLADQGFTELIQLRNEIARKAGWDNYWEMKNTTGGEVVGRFLSGMENLLKRAPAPEKASVKPGIDHLQDISFVEALIFYCSVLFADSRIPNMELFARTGNECPPGPPAVFPMSYRPESRPTGSPGHLIGIDFPFVHDGKLKGGFLGTLFHELTHLFHFASIDDRGGHAFPPELASGHLLYEIQALCFQSILIALWSEEPLMADSESLKDLVYLAQSEKLLYESGISSSEELKEFIYSRMKTVYPDGGFIRTPLGASHILIAGNSARYWEYPAAFWLGKRKAYDLVEDKPCLSVPDSWKAGNEAAWTDPSEEDLKENGGFYFPGGHFFAAEIILEKRNDEDIRKELSAAGLNRFFE